MVLSASLIQNYSTSYFRALTMRFKQVALVSSLILILSLGWNVGVGQLLSWNTYGNLGTEATEPSVFNNANISAANLTQGLITAAANGNRFGGSNWFNTGNTAAGNTLSEAVTGNDYMQFVVTPNSGYTFTPTSFVFQWDKSATGPKNVTLRSSADNYVADLGTITGVAAIGTSNTITISGLNGLAVATTFRLYGYGATSTGGTGGFDLPTNVNVINVQLNGTVATSSNTITYDGNGNTGGTVPASFSLSSGATTNVSTNSGSLVKAGYTFNGWNTAANGTGNPYATSSNITISANTTLYAQWTINNNTITFNANGGIGTMSNQTIATAATATLTTNTFSNSGFSFTAWNTAADGTGTFYLDGATYTMGTSNVSLFAFWTSLSAPSCPFSSSIAPNTAQTLCQGFAAATLTATVANNGTTGTATKLYQWYYNTTNSNAVSGATSISGATAVTYIPTSAGTEGIRYYFCVGYATDNTCGQSSTTQRLASNAVMVTVNPTPSTPTAGSVGTCTGTTLSLTVLTIASATYSWTGPNSFTAATQYPSVNAIATTAMSGVYSVIATVNGCVSASGTTTVTLNSTPAAPTGTSTQSFCNGTTPTIASFIVVGASPLWYNASTAGSLLATSTSLVSGTHYFVSQTSSGCESPRFDVTAMILGSINYGTATTVNASNNHLVISQVYGGGGNAGATYTNDFIELFNPTASAVSINGWSLQYTNNTGPTAPALWNVNNLSGTIGAGKYFLIQLASSGTVGIALPAADLTITSNVINLAAASGKIALVNNTTALSATAPSSTLYTDLVGYGSGTNGYEGTAAAPAPSVTNAIFRASNGCTDNNQNSTDFPASAAANPRNSVTATNICSPVNTQTICTGLAPLPMYVGGAYGSGSFTYQWYSQTGSVTTPTGSSTSGWASLGSADGAQTSVYSPSTVINAQTTYAVFVTASGSPTCNAGVGQWATGVIVVSVNPVPNVSALANTIDNALSLASWTNPSNTSPNCWDEILVVANAGPVSFTPTGDGTAYTANPVYTTSNQVVYKGTGTSVNVTGLTNGIQYCFKVFVRKGSLWSTGVSNCVIPLTQIPVPDAGCQTASYASSVFNFPTNLVITKVTVGVKITTTFRQDLILRLVSPLGTEIILQNAVGSSAINLDALYDDLGTGSAATGDHVIDAVYDITCPAQGSPTQPLSTFNGEFSQGNWTLKVCDDAGGDLAFINDFKVFFTGTPVCVSTVNITSFSPQLGPVGTVVTFIGSGFTGATAVKFGNLNASTYTVVNDNTITAKLPPNATTSIITILDASGCAKNTSSFFTLISSTGSCGNIINGTGTDLFVSEVFDGTSGDDQYVEIFNPTSSQIFLSGYSLRITTVGSGGVPTPTDIAFTSGATIASGAVYLVRIGTIVTSICNLTVNQTNGTGGFNGNDEVFLLKALSVIDYVPNPPALLGAGFSQQRNASVTSPSVTYNSAEWTISDVESCSNLGISPYLAGPLITVTAQPQDVNCNTISFTTAATASTGTTSYLWKYFNPATGTWANASTIPSVTTNGTNAATMTITGSTAQLINYQFYCEINSGGCAVASNAAQYFYTSKPYYRCKTTGNWSDANIWEMSTSPTNWAAAATACTYPTKENSSAVFIETPFIITQDININIDYLEIKNGATLKTSTSSKLTVSDSTIGPDFIVNGIWEYNSGSSNSFGFDVATGTWQLGSNGTIIKTNSGGATTLKSNYEGGMSTIPATANWIMRYLGADVTFTTVGGTYYPNLTFESNSGLWSPLAASFGTRLSGNSDFATVKGNLDIGGTGTGRVTVYNENTNAQPMLIYGNLQIRNGDSLTNIGAANGTGFEIKGNIVVDGSGVFTASGGSGVVKLTGAAAQSVSGSGLINLRKLLVTNSAPAGQNVTFSKDISVPDTLEITQGFVDAGTTTLNGTAKLIMSNGSLQLSKNATVLPELTGAYLLTGGNVIFNGNGTSANAQTIRPVNYYNISSSSIGDRIMSPADTIGIANVFTKGTNSFTFTGSNIKYNGNTDQAIVSFTANNTINRTYNNLILSNTGIKSLSGPVDVEGALTLKDNITLALGSQDFTFKSTMTRTANINKIPSSTFLTYGIGRFVVERYLPTGTGIGQHGKSWQFLSIPTNGGQTINQAWQDTATAANQSRYVGYGTQITSNFPNATTSLGFDMLTPAGPSMKYYNNGIWSGVASTSIPIFNPKGYMVFVRGDRTVTTYSALNNANPTTLRTRGKIFEPRDNPPPTITINTGDTLISLGNPYASAVDFTLIEKDFAPGVHQGFWVWDPLKPSSLGLGGYQYLAAGNPGGDFSPLVGGTINYPGGPNRFIQSGQAFIIENNGSSGYINFLETAKAGGSSIAFRAPSINNNQTQSLKTLLYIGSGETAVLTDATLVTFKNAANNHYDSEDALKVFSPGENVAILRDTKTLVLESRKIVARIDTIYLSLSNLRRQTYEFRFTPESLPLSGMDIRLVDRFLGISTSISSGDSSFVDFSITADPGSSSSTRFIIVFKKVNQPIPHTITFLSETAKNIDPYLINTNLKDASIEVYPNPIKGHIAHISFINHPLGNYIARILNINGQVVLEKKMEIKSNFEEKDFQLVGLSKSSYQLQIIGAYGNLISKQIIIQ